MKRFPSFYDFALLMLAVFVGIGIWGAVKDYQNHPFAIPPAPADQDHGWRTLDASPVMVSGVKVVHFSDKERFYQGSAVLLSDADLVAGDQVRVISVTTQNNGFNPSTAWIVIESRKKKE